MIRAPVLADPMATRATKFCASDKSSARGCGTWIRVNDPSAGSPTETLLRLLLSLEHQVRATFRISKGNIKSPKGSQSVDLTKYSNR